MSFEIHPSIETGTGYSGFAFTGLAFLLVTAVTLQLEPALRALPPLLALPALGPIMMRFANRRAKRRASRPPRLTCRAGRWSLIQAGEACPVSLADAAYVEWPVAVVTVGFADGRVQRLAIRPGKLEPQARRRLRARLRAARM